MPYVSCKVCKKEFYVKPNRLKKGWGKYCSKTCNYEGQKTGKLFKCHTCNKSVYKNIKDQHRSKSGKFFCDKSCQTIWRNSFYSGKKHPNWTGGEYSYKNTLKRTGKKAECAKCKIVDHRVLAVHHKDRNRSNNSVSNLVWLCHNRHFLVHHYKNKVDDFMVPVA